jgi:hypothetical protein
MSDPTSPILPRSSLSSDELTEFGGDEAFASAWRDGLTPDPALSVSEWADQHRMLSPRASAEPGRYRTDRTPYMRAIMDALSPSDSTRRVVFMKAAQVGATEAGNNWIGYVIHHAPGPMLSVQPTVELAKRFSRQRVDPLIEESPILRARVKPSRSRDAGNTVLSKEFPAGLLVMTGANSAVGLRSMPARYLFLDEVDAYPPSADEEGDPVALAEHGTHLQLHALACNLGDFVRTLALPEAAKHWSLTALREKLVKIGAPIAPLMDYRDGPFNEGIGTPLTQRYATASSFSSARSTAFGLARITRNRVAAGPVGWVAPLSHFCRVRRGRP